VVAVSQEFEVDTHIIKTMELLNLRQSGFVEEYKQQFDQLTNRIRLYDQHISDTMLVSQFLLGIKDELRQFVEMHLPTSVTHAATLADVQEHLNNRLKLHQKKYANPKPEFKAAFNSNEL
jgi:hypothetical protein